MKGRWRGGTWRTARGRRPRNLSTFSLFLHLISSLPQVARGHVADSPWAGQVEVRECDALDELGRLAAAGEGPFQVRPGP